MIDVTTLFKGGLSSYLKIRERDIKSIVALRSTQYSAENQSKALQLFDLNDLERLKSIEWSDVNTTEDILFICEVLLVQGQKYLALIVDPYELYAPTLLIKVKQIN